MAKVKVSKKVGGVAIPPELRRAGNKLIDRVDSKLGREALAAGMTLAAAAAIAASGRAGHAPDRDNDAPDAPEPPVPPVPPVPPEPPVRPAAPKPTGTTIPISPAQAQAVADALGNVAEAAITRFLAGRRFG